MAVEVVQDVVEFEVPVHAADIDAFGTVSFKCSTGIKNVPGLTETVKVKFWLCDELKLIGPCVTVLLAALYTPPLIQVTVVGNVSVI